EVFLAEGFGGEVEGTEFFARRGADASGDGENAGGREVADHEADGFDGVEVGFLGGVGAAGAEASDGWEGDEVEGLRGGGEESAGFLVNDGYARGLIDVA